MTAKDDQDSSSEDLPYVHQFYTTATRLAVLDRRSAAVESTVSSAYPAVDEFYSQATRSRLLAEYGNAGTSVDPAIATAFSADLWSSCKLPFVHEYYSQSTRLAVLDDQAGSSASSGRMSSIAASAEDDTPDRLGDYLLEQRLGEGGMGTVYRGRHVDGDTAVAVKVIRTNRLADRRGVERFWAEIKTLSRFDHPGICKLIDFGHQGTVDYLVMELIAGQPFDRWLADEKPGFQHAALMLAEIADAVAYANDQGTIHRDLAPGNVMVRDDGRPVVMDFGLAWEIQRETRLTMTGQAMGTPVFMAPEQTLGKEGTIGPWTDVWGLGVLMYFCFTGKLPFGGDSSHDVFIAINDHEPVAPHRLKPDLPLPLDHIIQRCLQKPLSDRYADCIALGDDLRQFAAGNKVQVPLPGVVRRAGKRLRKYPLVSALVFLVVVLFGGFGSWAGITWYRQWGGWHTLSEWQGTDGELPTNLQFRTSLLDPMAEPSYSLNPTGLTVDPDIRGRAGWLWWEDPGAGDGLRVELELSWGEEDDCVDICLRPSEQPMLRWHFHPAGWVIRVWRDETGAVVARHQEQPAFIPPLGRITVPTLAKAKRTAVLLSLVDEELQVHIDGRQVWRQRAPLSSTLAARPAIAMRWYRPGTTLVGCRLHRFGQPQLASPLIAADALVSSGNYEDALARYRLLAVDHQGTALGARALERAVLVSEKLNRDFTDDAILQQLWRALLGDATASDVIQTIDVVRMRRLFFERRFDAAIELAERLVGNGLSIRQVDNAVKLLLPTFSPSQARRLARLFATTSGLKQLHFSQWPLDVLPPIRPGTIDLLAIDHTAITDLSSLAGRRIRVCRLGGGSAMVDIASLGDCRINQLNIRGDAVRGLANLNQLALSNLTVHDMMVQTWPDGLLLDGLEILNSKIPELASVIGPQMHSLSLHRTPLPDPAALLQLPQRINSLALVDADIGDLTGLAGRRIGRLTIGGATVPSGTIDLRGLQVENLVLNDLNSPIRGWPDLTALKSLAIKGQPEEMLAGLSIPDLGSLGSFRQLTIENVKLDKIPELPTGLVTLKLRHCGLQRISPGALPESLEVIDLGGNQLTSIDWLRLLSPGQIIVDWEQLTIGQLRTLAVIWSERGYLHHASSLLTIADMAHGHMHLLQHRAQVFPDGRRFLYIPGYFTLREAEVLADRCGARLATIDSAETNATLRGLRMLGRGAWIGYREDLTSGGHWHGGGSSSFRALGWQREARDMALQGRTIYWNMGLTGEWYPYLQDEHSSGVLLEWPPLAPAKQSRHGVN